MLIDLHIVCGCFRHTTAEVSSYGRDSLTCKLKIHQMVIFTEKGILTPGPAAPESLIIINSKLVKYYLQHTRVMMVLISILLRSSFYLSVCFKFFEIFIYNSYIGNTFKFNFIFNMHFTYRYIFKCTLKILYLFALSATFLKRVNYSLLFFNFHSL